MNKTLKEIELILENCEIITVDKSLIGRIYGDVFNQIGFDDCYYETKTIKDVELTISKDLGKDKIERLEQYCDITRIDFIFENASEQEYFVEYIDKNEGMLGSPNILQGNEITCEGDIYIKIGHKPTSEVFKDYLDPSEKDCVDLEFGRYEI